MPLLNRRKKIIFYLYSGNIFNDQTNFQTCNLNQSLIFEQNESVVGIAVGVHLL